MKSLKIALVHDYIKEYGGAERVLEALHEMLPEAPVYTSVYLPEFLGPHKERLADWEIKTSWLQKVPFKHKLISPFRLLAPFIFGQFDLSDYDVVIVSATGAYFPNSVRSKKMYLKQKAGVKGEGAIQICYCHTPPRYLYGYSTARDWKKYKIVEVLGSVMNHFLRMVDFEVSKNVDFYIANSQEVAGRIKKFYRKDSKVIYPSVDINSEFRIQNSESKREKYYLTGGRLARAKHTDLIIEACMKSGIRLKVFGKGFAGYEEDLRTLADGMKDGGIEFLGEVSDEAKAKLMRRAKGFIFAGEDEDFGIVPVEAMGNGIGVIAYRSGGVNETVIEGRTGVFFEELNVVSLKKAIDKFEKLKFEREFIRKHAERFSKERFVKEIYQFINSKM
jgi:glycosyltransferase involved in cell wall biosynthesis